tara:strand:+ start:1161 stop:3461 length:2301 start_codon:yes stop_codon:yes gene_type:complete
MNMKKQTIFLIALIIAFAIGSEAVHGGENKYYSADLPEKATAALDGSSTTARIFLSATVDYLGDTIARKNISLPRALSFKVKIMPDSKHLGEFARILFFVYFENQFYMVHKPAYGEPEGIKVSTYDGSTIRDYETRVLQSENNFDILALELTEEFKGEYELFSGYQLVNQPDIIIFNSEPAPMLLSYMWPLSNSKKWTGEQLEVASEFCKQGAFRWPPVSNFDINLDGVNDFFMPISCYQTAIDPVTLHNVKVHGQWKMFCSVENDFHEDCTYALFGDQFIDVTMNDTGGGNPYTHVMDKPRDLNGDGYPEFWYAMNRDDGRVASKDTDFELLKSLCPDREAWELWQGRVGEDCTRVSLHSILLSKEDGTYDVIPLDVWGRGVSHNMHVLPNEEGGSDFIIWGSSGLRAARLSGRELIDKTEEYRSLINGKTIESAAYYNRVIDHEGKTYFITPDVRVEAIENPSKIEFDFRGPFVDGFTLWEWKPGEGFYLSDYYTPDQDDYFDYKLNDSGSIEEGRGVYIKGAPVFKPNWNFFRFEQLGPDEDPTLIVFHESDGGTTFGPYFKAKFDNNAVYTYYKFDGIDIDAQGNRDPYLITDHLNPVEGFHIRNGKILVREKSVVNGDYVFLLTRMDFEDLNGDGYLDMLGTALPKGQVFLNNGSGTLYRLNTESVWPFNIDYGGNEKQQFNGSIFNLGNAPFLDFVYWSQGWMYRPRSMSSETQYKAGNIGIIRAEYPISSLPIKTVDEMQNDIELCVRSGRYRNTCYIF